MTGEILQRHAEQHQRRDREDDIDVAAGVEVTTVAPVGPVCRRGSSGANRSRPSQRAMVIGDRM